MVAIAITGFVLAIIGTVLTLMDYSGMIENIPQQIDIRPLIIASISGASLGASIVAGLVAIGNWRRSKKETALANHYAKCETRYTTCETVLYLYFEKVALRLESTEIDQQKLHHILNNQDELLRYAVESREFANDIASVLDIEAPCYPTSPQYHERGRWRDFLKHVLVYRTLDELRTALKN